MADFDIDTFMSEQLSTDRLQALRKVDLKAVGMKLSLNLAGNKSKAELVDLISAHVGLSVATAALDRPTDETSNGTTTVTGRSNCNDVDLELAKIELEERRDRLKAAEHEREMERKRLDMEIMRYSEMSSQCSQSSERERR